MTLSGVFLGPEELCSPGPTHTSAFDYPLITLISPWGQPRIFPWLKEALQCGGQKEAGGLMVCSKKGLETIKCNQDFSLEMS